MTHDDNDFDLGPCCTCLEHRIDVRNILMLPLRAPVPGTGWGCVVCHLPADGAVAVLCDACVGEAPRYACDGYPKDGGRIPVGLLSGPFDHDPRVDHDG